MADQLFVLCEDLSGVAFMRLTWLQNIKLGQKLNLNIAITDM